MPLLVYRDLDGEMSNVAFTRSIALAGSVEGPLFAQAQAPGGEHLLITRAVVTQMPVLLPPAGDPGRVRVNGLPVAGLQVLRHGDRIGIDLDEVVYWEVVLRTADDVDAARLGPCPVCRSALRAGQWVVECPRCHVVQHRRCWFGIVRCPTHACVYPILQTVWRALAPPARFERLESGSSLVKERRRCTAGSRRDRGNFKDGEVAVYCPGCEQPFHASCWLELRECPTTGCGFSVASLIRSAFTPGMDETRIPARRRA
jgi:hypothetical protein